MSLEAAMAEMTAALKENTAAIQQANEGRAAAVEGIKDAVGAKSGRPAGAKDKAKDKTPAETKPAPAAASKAITLEDFRTQAGGWLNKSPELKPARKEFVKSITEHFGVGQLTEISPDEFPKILVWLERKGRGEDVDFSEGQDDQPAAPAVEEDDDDLV